MRVEIPSPIGESFHHRYRNGQLAHHETAWKNGLAVCGVCGIEAVESSFPVRVFLKDDVRLEGLRALFVE